MNDRLESLRRAVEMAYRCKARHAASTPVLEFWRRSGLDGVIETFELEDRRKPDPAAFKLGHYPKLIRQTVDDVLWQDRCRMAELKDKPPNVDRRMAITISLRNKPVSYVMPECVPVFLNQKPAHFEDEVGAEYRIHFGHVEQWSHGFDRLGQVGMKIRYIGSALIKNMPN